MNHRDFYVGKKVLVTGFSGYIGSHLGIFLKNMGAYVIGVSRLSGTSSCIYDVTDTSSKIVKCNIQQRNEVEELFTKFKPEIVFHLGGIADVNFGRQHPHETFSTNIVGTMNILEACRISESIQSIVVVSTSRARMENNTCPLKDPYSISKCCVNMISESYYQNYMKEISMIILNLTNVTGGGDLQFKRLFPKCIQKWKNGEKITLNVKGLMIPFVHMYDVCFSIISFGNNKSYEGRIVYIMPDKIEPIEQLVERFGNLWNKDKSFEELVEIDKDAQTVEMKDIRETLPSENVFESVLTHEKSMMMTMEWYKKYFIDPQSVSEITNEQLKEYEEILKLTKERRKVYID